MSQSFANLAAPAAIELEALLRDYLLGLVLIAGAQRTDEERLVQWVHSSDLDDPTPFLTPRTVLLTTGRQFAASLENDEAEAYVGRLLNAGTTALGVAIGVQWDRIPPTLIEACERLQLPLFRVPYDTPFIAVVRTAARLIEAASHTGEPWDREVGSSSSLLRRRQSLTAVEEALRRAVLQLLLTGHRDMAEEIAAPLLPRLPRGQLVVASFAERLSSRAISELTPVLTDRPGVFSAQLGGQFTVIIEADEVAELRTLFTRHSVEAGLSERGAMAEAAELLGQAERAHDLATLRGTQSPLSYLPEMHRGVLQLLHESPEARRRAKGLLNPLRRHDSRHSDDLEHSLVTWLAHHGQTSAAAAQLGVHRHTLRNRITTAAHLLQRDLDDPDSRAELWAALRLTD
jgi:purine catabolism regulator